MGYIVMIMTKDGSTIRVDTPSQMEAIDAFFEHEGHPEVERIFLIEKMSPEEGCILIAA